MRCIHLRSGEKKECALGISPMDCDFCGMREVKSWRTSQQPTANSPNTRSVVSDNGVNVVVSGGTEQKLLQSSAVKGGCGCHKK